jgi:hypothetical protein
MTLAQLLALSGMETRRARPAQSFRRVGMAEWVKAMTADG